MILYASCVNFTPSGVIGLRVDGPRGALVEVNSETDFVARNAKFQGFVEKALEAALEKAAGGGAVPVTRELDVHELLRVERPGEEIYIYICFSFFFYMRAACLISLCLLFVCSPSKTSPLSLGLLIRISCCSCIT